MINKPPFNNCSFAICDLPGQCKKEGRCHHPSSEAELTELRAKLEEQAKLLHVMREAAKEMIDSHAAKYPSEENGEAAQTAWVNRKAEAIEKLEQALATPDTSGFVVCNANVIAFLNGSGELDGRWFGDMKDGKAFWWRKYLPKLYAKA